MDNKKIVGLKINLKKQGIFLASLICILITGNWFFSYKKDDLIKQKTQLEAEVRNLNSKYSELSSRSAEIKEALQLWKSLNDNERKNTGLKIDEAKDTLDYLKKEYYIAQDFSINLTPPTELSQDFKTATTIVVQSTVDMTLSSFSDLNLLNFVSDMSKKLTGFIKITEFRITKSRELTDDDLVNIRKGQFPSLVSMQLKFFWRDLKDVGPGTKGGGAK